MWSGSGSPISGVRVAIGYEALAAADPLAETDLFRFDWLRFEQGRAHGEGADFVGACGLFRGVL